jgi:nucleotide-binding universal stress UspA family protein
MYKHILIPIDDSKLADTAIKNGIALARSMQARITGFTAMPEYQPPSETEMIARRAISLPAHEKTCAKKAKAILGRLARRASAAGVQCETDYVLDDRPDQAIARAAEKHGCDLILMASHGRSGLSALINGSETRGVLAKSKVPTLVYR